MPRTVVQEAQGMDQEAIDAGLPNLTLMVFGLIAGAMVRLMGVPWVLRYVRLLARVAESASPAEINAALAGTGLQVAPKE